MIAKERIAALLACIFLGSATFHIIELWRLAAFQGPANTRLSDLEESFMMITWFACPFASAGYLLITLGGMHRKMRVVALAFFLSSAFYLWQGLVLSRS